MAAGKRASHGGSTAAGGSAPGSNWLRKQDVPGILEDEGFETEAFFDELPHQNGPAFCVFARRRQIASASA
jgi:hypothetical protein